jgi:hypothetical protein
MVNMAVFTSNPVIGVDISKWQYSMDIPLLLEAGVKVFIIKIGENGILDPSFYKHAQNVTNYTAQGAVLMAYYWDDITTSSATQTTWLVKEVNKSGLPIKYTWLDDEQWWTNWTLWQKAMNDTIPWTSVPAASAASISSHFQTTYNSLVNGVGKEKCGIYVNKSFCDGHTPQMATWLTSEGVNLWIPYYANQSQPPVTTKMTWQTWRTTYFPNYTPPLPTGCVYAYMRAHQCTGDKCQVPGIYSNVFKQLSPSDINVIDGVWLNKLLGTTPVLPTPPQPTYPEYVAMYTLNIHSAPNSISTIIGYLPVHSVVKVYATISGYSRIDPVESKWVYTAYLQPV